MEALATAMLIAAAAWIYAHASNSKYNEREYYFLKNYYLIKENENIEIVSTHRHGNYFVAVEDDGKEKYMFFRRSVDFRKTLKQLEDNRVKCRYGERISDLPPGY